MWLLTVHGLKSHKENGISSSGFLSHRGSFCLHTAGGYLPLIVHIHSDIFLGGNLTVFGIHFFELHLNISDLFTFICPHVILAGYFFPMKTEELSNCKIRRRPMPPDIPFLPMTEPRCHSAHLWVAGGHLHTASPGRPWAPALQARAVQPHFSHCLSAQHPRLFTKPEPSALVKCF